MTEEDNVLFGIALQNARKKAGKSQKELAAELSVSPQMVSLYEMGKAFPSFHVLMRAISALRCQPSDLLRRKEDR